MNSPPFGFGGCIVIKDSIKLFLQRSCTIDSTIKLFVKESWFLVVDPY